MSRMRALAELIQRNRATDPPRAIDEEALLPSDGYMVSRAKWERRVLAAGIAESVDELPSGTRVGEIISELIWAIKVIGRTAGSVGHKKLVAHWPDAFGSGGTMYPDETRGRRVVRVYAVDEIGEAETILAWLALIEDERTRRALASWCGTKATGGKPSKHSHRIGLSPTTHAELRDAGAAAIAIHLDRRGTP